MRWLCLLLLAGCARHALQGAPETAALEFPRDDGAHDAQTEWWHFHGHLKDQHGGQHDFFVGFVRWHTDEDRFLFIPLRFFVDPGQAAVFSYTDRATREHRGREKYAYPDVWAASAARGKLELSHDDWSARGLPDGTHLVASAKGVGLDLVLSGGKPAVLEGDGGRFESPPHLFYTLPRLMASGHLVKDGERLEVTGLAWAKHEWGFLYSDQVAGWVWFGVQLDDGTDLQIGLIKNRDWQQMPGSFAELVDEDGGVRRLELSRLGVQQTGETWTSARSGVTWPVGWRLELPDGGGELELSTTVPGQELFAFPAPIWAGSLEVKGTRAGHAVHGDAMAEVFGLRQPFFRRFIHSGRPAGGAR